MHKIQKNIWLLFWLIALLGVLFLGMTVNLRWQDNYHRISQSQRSMSKLLNKAIHSSYLQYELLLDVLGSELIQNDLYKDPARSKSVFNRLLTTDRKIAGFGLADPTGQLTLVSSNMDVSKIPNLLEQEQSADSFRAAMARKVMSAGRNYYMPALGKWVLPLRKPIFDSSGQVVAVMTLGIVLEDFVNELGSSIDVSNDTRVIIFRDDDHYHQLRFSTEEGSIADYSKPVPETVIQKTFTLLSEAAGSPLEELKTGDTSISFEFSNSQDERLLASALYDSRYHHWVIVSTTFSWVWTEFLRSVFFIAFIISGGFLFTLLLVRYIGKKEKESGQRLHYQACHDPLTQLFNRHYLNQPDQKWLGTKDAPCSLLYIDLDRFKYVNDNFGHAIGDELLQLVAQRLKLLFSEQETIIRQGGDEFLVFTGEAIPAEIQLIAERTIESLSQPYFIGDYSLEIGASIGITRFPFDGDSQEALFHTADIALYESKKYKGIATLYDQVLGTQHHRRLQLERLLKLAVEKSEIYLVYQPQVDAAGELIGVEALVRWHNDELGMIRPDEFIAVAEQTGQIVSLGRYIVETALKEVSAFQREHQLDFSLSLNISIKQFIANGFVEHLLEQASINRFANNKLVLEVTESLFVDDVTNIQRVLALLKSKGISISLDDFGTGYSSLSILKSLPIEELKIDKTFVDDITLDDKARQMARSIITIGKALGITTVAEGVENKQQLDLLASLGCSTYQGYYFAKPMPLSELLRCNQVSPQAASFKGKPELVGS